MRTPVLPIVCVLIAGFTPTHSSASARPGAPEIEREMERLAAAHTYWPGFEPLTIPLAVYDGTRTFLFRHPSPPAGFKPLKGSDATYTMDGRYETVTSNTNEVIGGVPTATLRADGKGGGRSATDLAAVALHESFHVYQRAHHPGWISNEGDVFLYPIDDARLLALRRTETEALRRALAARDDADAACWTRQALAARRERFAAMDSAFACYERGTELNEGLATYVQLVAGGKTTVEFPAGEFAAAEVRQRVYTVGPALAFLLDRFRPGWKEALEDDDDQFLDVFLGDALAARPSDAPARCAFTQAETAGIQETARKDAASVAAGRTDRRKAFDAQPGWRIVVEADASAPLWPNGFDPLNVERVDGGLLHSRYLRLANDAGSLEAIDEEGADVAVFTEGPGPHPLFNGVTRVIVAGIAKPVVNVSGDRVTVKAPGVTVDLKNATVHEEAGEVRIRLSAAAR